VVHVEGLAVSGGLVVNTNLASRDEVVHVLPQLPLEAVTLALAEEELVVLVGGGVEAVALEPVGEGSVVKGGLLEPHAAANLAVLVAATVLEAAGVDPAPLVIALGAADDGVLQLVIMAVVASGTGTV
jgi:hypothetical protein